MALGRMRDVDKLEAVLRTADREDKWLSLPEMQARIVERFGAYIPEASLSARFRDLRALCEVRRIVGGLRAEPARRRRAGKPLREYRMRFAARGGDR